MVLAPVTRNCCSQLETIDNILFVFWCYCCLTFSPTMSTISNLIESKISVKALWRNRISID